MSAWSRGRAAVNLAGCPDRLREEEELSCYLGESYVPFFRAKKGISAPLYQSYYQGEEGLLMDRLAAMVGRRLQAVGLFLKGCCGESLDHLDVEVE